MKNAIILMFDSLQYTYIGCYGNSWIRTPNMDRLAREGVLFENCYIEGLPTVPCRRAMHTGRYTLPVAGWHPLEKDDTTIADLCWGRPIDTALIFDCPMYRLPKFGYTRGFDKVFFTHGHEGDQYFYAEEPLLHYNAEDYHEQYLLENADERMNGKVVAPLLHETNCYLKLMQNWRSPEDRFVAKTIRKAIEYLEQVDRTKQFYLWIDSFDPHEPWNPPSVWNNTPCEYDPDYKGKNQFLPILGPADVYTEEQLHHIRMLYAELVTLCDTYLGVFLDAIRRLGFEENTLFMMVSDHGEPMGNGEHGHGIMRKCRPWPYDELVHAPMILKAPGVKPGQRIKAFVQSVDIAPTVCDWLGIGVHPDMQGKSLMPLVRGEVEKVRDFAIAGYYRYSWAIYTEEWSYIHWLQKDASHELFTMDQGSAMGQTSSHLKAVGGKVIGYTPEDKARLLSQSEKLLKEAATLDGEEQWTCTPGAVAEVPDSDELYYTPNDPHQLNNVIAKHPDIAANLLKTLKGHISEIRAS